MIKIKIYNLNNAYVFDIANSRHLTTHKYRHTVLLSLNKATEVGHNTVVVRRMEEDLRMEVDLLHTQASLNTMAISLPTLFFINSHNRSMLNNSSDRGATTTVVLLFFVVVKHVSCSRHSIYWLQSTINGLPFKVFAWSYSLIAAVVFAMLWIREFGLNIYSTIKDLI